MDEDKTNRDKKISLRFKVAAILVVAVLFVTLLLPVFAGESGIGIIREILEGSGGSINPLGDDPPLDNNSAAFHYEHFVPPDNSFGIGETTFKTPIFSYWKSWLKENFYWNLQGSPNGDVWYDDTIGLMDIGIDWDSVNTTAKVTLTLDTTNAPMALFYRFDLGCNASLKSYINKSSNYEYTLTLPANATEDYTIFFNFSDIKPLIQNGKVTAHSGVKNIDGKDYIGFRVQTVNKIQIGRAHV